MDLPTALGSHLRDLVGGFGIEDDTLTVSLATLAEDMRTAVSSYHGLRLTLVPDGWPVTLTAFSNGDGERPGTSLRLALSTVGDDFDAGSQIVLYAGTPGAFVDLEADLAYLRRSGQEPDPPGASADGNGSAGPDGHRPGVALDIDLPPVSRVSGFSGLTEYATINRAMGLLIDRGADLDQARATLDRGATAGGHALPVYAARLLQGEPAA